jgi:hypothetical protein
MAVGMILCLTLGGSLGTLAAAVIVHSGRRLGWKSLSAALEVLTRSLEVALVGGTLFDQLRHLPYQACFMTI